MHLQDTDLIPKLRKGDEAVFEMAFREYYERLCNYANTIVKDMPESEEIVQGTFLTLWEKREEIEIHTSVKSYLYRSVHNTCLNRIKHQKVKQDHYDYCQSMPEATDISASQQLIGKELELKINAAVEQMPDQCRKVFELSRFEELTYSEIAEKLEISIKTVEKHKMKALRILREELKDYLPLLLMILFSKN